MLGVIVACDKSGRVPFDQMDEVNLTTMASIAAIALRHALDKLNWKHDERRRGLLVTATTGMLTVASFSDLLTRGGSSAAALSGASQAQFFVLNATADSLVSLAQAFPVEEKQPLPELIGKLQFRGCRVQISGCRVQIS